MGISTGWSSTNRLVRRVRRHAAFATLFRSSLPADTGSLYSSSRLVMGHFGQVQAGDGWTSAAPEVQAPASPASAVQRPAVVAANVTAPETVETSHAAVNVVLPVHGQTVSFNQTASIQPGRIIQTANMPSASPAEIGAAPLPAEVAAGAPLDQITFGRESSDADQTWRRLQRIRELHEQKLAAAEAVPSDMAAEVQRTPAKPQPSATPPIAPVAQVASGSPILSSSISESAQAAQTVLPADGSVQRMSVESLSTPPSTRSNDPGAIMRSTATANLSALNQPVAASSAPSLDSRVIDQPSGHVSASNIHSDIAQDVVHVGAVRSRTADDPSALVAQSTPVESTSMATGMSMAGAPDTRPFDPPAPPASVHQSSVQRASLETAWPVIDGSSAVPGVDLVEPVQDAGAAPEMSGDEVSDGYAADVVHQQVAKIDAQVATDSKVDVITPRRPPPSVRKVSAALQSDAVQPEPKRREIVQSAPALNLAQRSMVETEIGALPADLWRLIGEEAPVGNDRKQPRASRHDAHMAEAVSSVDATVMQRAQRSSTPDIETNQPAEHTAGLMVGSGAKTAVDNLATVGQSDVAQLASETPAAANSAVERQATLLAGQRSPAGLSDLSNESVTPIVSDARDEPAAAQSERAVQPDVDAPPSLATNQQQMTNSATQRPDLADGIAAVRGESTQGRDSLASADLTAANNSSNAGRMASDSASIQTGVHFQTVQLAPTETALQSVSRADAGVASLGMSESVGQKEEINVDDLAQKVYRQLRRKLALEWERLRPVRY